MVHVRSQQRRKIRRGVQGVFDDEALQAIPSLVSLGIEFHQSLHQFSLVSIPFYPRFFAKHEGREP